MSWEALAYVRKLTTCPDGAALTCAMKCVLLLLAHAHNSDAHAAWPSMATLANDSCQSWDTVNRAISFMEGHCLLEQHKPLSQGKGRLCTYTLPALDNPERLKSLLAEKSKGSQGAPLFSPPERVAQGSHAEPQRVAEGSHTHLRNKEEQGTNLTGTRNGAPERARMFLPDELRNRSDDDLRLIVEQMFIRNETVPAHLWPWMNRDTKSRIEVQTHVPT